jgi:hypothetical protein
MQAHGGGGKRIGIAIDADDVFNTRVQQSRSVTSTTQGAVEHPPSIAQQLDYLGNEDGRVIRAFETHAQLYHIPRGASPSSCEDALEIAAGTGVVTRAIARWSPLEVAFGPGSIEGKIQALVIQVFK